MKCFSNQLSICSSWHQPILNQHAHPCPLGHFICQWNRSVFLIFSKVWISPCEVWPILVENSNHGPSSQFTSVDSTWKRNCSVTVFSFTSWFSSTGRSDGWKQLLGPQDLAHPSYVFQGRISKMGQSHFEGKDAPDFLEMVVSQVTSNNSLSSRRAQLCPLYPPGSHCSIWFIVVSTKHTQKNHTYPFSFPKGLELIFPRVWTSRMSLSCLVMTIAHEALFLEDLLMENGFQC